MLRHPQGGYLRQDPRQAQAAWQDVLRPVLGGLGVEAGGSDVAQVWGRHQVPLVQLVHVTVVCAAFLLAMGPLRAADSHLAPCACAYVQLLNVAYAQHELTGGSTGAALAWLEAGGAASIEDLLRQPSGQGDRLQAE